jgi:pyruvate/2-oxoglutarate dehydrogenase complex dihydrolipoamide acyltransferase (E2) component
MKKRLPILLLLAAAGGGYYFYTQREAAANAGKLQISGNLELTQVDLSFKTAGRIVELNVREGEWVKKGQVIARLDASQLDQQKARDMAAVSGAQSNYQQLQTAIEFQRATIESDIEARRPRRRPASTTCLPAAAARRSRRRRPPSPTSRPPTIWPRPSGNAHRHCSPAKTSHARSTIRPARASTPRPLNSEPPSNASRWFRKVPARKKSRPPEPPSHAPRPPSQPPKPTRSS